MVMQRGDFAGVDIYRVQGKIEDIEYDIKGSDYINHNKTMYYKHMGESLIQKASGSIWKKFLVSFQNWKKEN